MMGDSVARLSIIISRPDIHRADGVVGIHFNFSHLEEFPASGMLPGGIGSSLANQKKKINWLFHLDQPEMGGLFYNSPLEWFDFLKWRYLRRLRSNRSSWVISSSPTPLKISRNPVISSIIWFERTQVKATPFEFVPSDARKVLKRSPKSAVRIFPIKNPPGSTRRSNRRRKGGFRERHVLCKAASGSTISLRSARTWSAFMARSSWISNAIRCSASLFFCAKNS